MLIIKACDINGIVGDCTTRTNVANLCEYDSVAWVTFIVSIVSN